MEASPNLHTVVLPTSKLGLRIPGLYAPLCKRLDPRLCVPRCLTLPPTDSRLPTRAHPLRRCIHLLALCRLGQLRQATGFKATQSLDCHLILQVMCQSPSWRSHLSITLLAAQAGLMSCTGDHTRSTCCCLPRHSLRCLDSIPASVPSAASAAALPYLNECCPKPI